MTVSVPVVSVSECEVTSPVPGWGAGHQGPAEAGTVLPPSLPSLMTVTAGRGAGHCYGTGEGVGDAPSNAPGPGDAPGAPPGHTPCAEEEGPPVVVASPVPALSGDSDCVLAGPKF